jgi:hypothetical protein
VLIPAHSGLGATLLKPIPLNYGITMVSEAILGVKETWGGFGEMLGTKNRCGPSDYLTISD